MTNYPEAVSVGNEARNVGGGNSERVGVLGEISSMDINTGNEEVAGRASGEVSRFDDCPREGTSIRASVSSEGSGMSRVQRFWNAQAEWSQATFGTDNERDHIGPLKHLAKEAVEAQVRPSDPVEIADCLFLVFDAARRSGMTLDTLISVAEQKLLVNKFRKWQKPTDDNPVEHVRD
jgi:dATP/dGTP diphosphohydrolase